MSIDCSIVIPVYYNEGSLRSTYDGLVSEVFDASPDRQFEVVFVDDGSGDGSLAELREIQRRDPSRVTVVKLSRNFGQVSAILAGLTAAQGTCCVTISADGQDPPELIREMLQAHFDEGFEIAIAAREGRDESIWRAWTSRVFYRLMRRLAYPRMPRGGFDYFLVGPKAKRALLGNLESHMFLQGQVLWTGFDFKTLPYRRRERRVGTSRWTFGMKLTYLLDGVLSQSFLPLRAISILGFLVAALGFAYAVVVIAAKLTWGHPVEGWTPLMVVVLVLGGTQMLMLGMIGEYLWRALAQARRRDPFVVDETYAAVPADAEVQTDPS
jgi:dolichol-phosphate mannosyltransferase